MNKQFMLLLTMISGLSITVLAQNEPTTNKNPNVAIEFYQQQSAKAKEPRKQPTGEKPAGLIVPKLLTDANTKERNKIKEMVESGFVLPLDYADLAEKRTNGDLVELPIATETYIVDVGGNADDSEFNSFSFEDGSTPLSPDSPKFAVLEKLANDFDGEKYYLNNPKHRLQMKIRFLRMISPEAQEIIEEIADSYQKKFNRPLRITSLVRSVEYQKDRNAIDPSSYLVRNSNARPPHVTGFAFDIARKHLTAAEQNFVMNQLSQLETDGKVDATIENGANAVFHVFAIENTDVKKFIIGV